MVYTAFNEDIFDLMSRRRVSSSISVSFLANRPFMIAPVEFNSRNGISTGSNTRKGFFFKRAHW